MVNKSMSVAVLLASLKQEAVYITSYITNQTVRDCASFQTLYESETCCSNPTLAGEFIVLRRPSSVCEVGWRSVRLGAVDRCVKLHETAVWTKSEATAACTTEGGRLVEPRTQVDDDVLKALINSIDEGQVSWLYFWIGMTQDPTESDLNTGWTWDADATPLVYTGWQSGQPTSYIGAVDDGPEDCALYRKGYGWYDFACSPAATVVCMAPKFSVTIPSFGVFEFCWGPDDSDGFEFTDVTSRETPVCLKVLDTPAYNLALAKEACGAMNAQLYYPTTASENDDFADWVWGKGTPGDKKVWLNIVQSPSATDPAQDWIFH